MTKKILSLISFLLATTVLLNGTIEEIKLKVDNLNCDYCAQKLTKRLSQLPTIKNITLNKGKALVTLELEKKNTISPIVLKNLIEKNTRYTIRDIRISAVGNIERQRENLIFNAGGNSPKIYLAQIKDIPKNKTSKHEAGFVANTGKVWNRTTSIVKGFFLPSDKFENQLKQFLNYKTSVRLIGSIKQNPNGQLWLSSKYYAHLKEATNEGVRFTFASKK